MGGFSAEDRQGSVLYKLFSQKVFKSLLSLTNSDCEMFNGVMLRNIPGFERERHIRRNFAPHVIIIYNLDFNTGGCSVTDEK